MENGKHRKLKSTKNVTQKLMGNQQKKSKNNGNDNDNDDGDDDAVEDTNSQMTTVH